MQGRRAPPAGIRPLREGRHAAAGDCAWPRLFRRAEEARGGGGSGGGSTIEGSRAGQVERSIPHHSCCSPALQRDPVIVGILVSARLAPRALWYDVIVRNLRLPRVLARATGRCSVTCGFVPLLLITSRFNHRDLRSSGHADPLLLRFWPNCQLATDIVFRPHLANPYPHLHEREGVCEM